MTADQNSRFTNFTQNFDAFKEEKYEQEKKGVP